MPSLQACAAGTSLPELASAHGMGLYKEGLQDVELTYLVSRLEVVRDAANIVHHQTQDLGLVQLQQHTTRNF